MRLWRQSCLHVALHGSDIFHVSPFHAQTDPQMHMPDPAAADAFDVAVKPGAIAADPIIGPLS